MSLFLVGLFAFGYFASGEVVTADFLVPFPVALVSVAVAVASISAYLFAPSEKLAQITLAIYLGLSANVALLLILTHPINSPFIALWILVSVFAGLFGTRTLIGFLVGVNIYLVSQLFVFHQLDAQSDILIFVLAYEIPVLASWLIWHHKSHPDTQKDKAYSELVRELSQVANKSEIVINAINDGVVAVDSQGTIQLINPAAQSIIGWGKQDALKLDYKSVIKLLNKTGEAVNENTDPIQQVLRTNNPVTTNELQLETSSGKKLLVSVSASPVGQIGAGAIIVFRDITHEKEEERQQAEFISTASHEMRTPVATIEGYLGLALNPNTAAIDEKARDYLTKASASVKHLGNLFQDLLDISRVEDGRLKNNPKVVDLVAFVGEIVSTFDARAKEKGLVLMFKPTTQQNGIGHPLSPVYYVDVDNDHLREVVSNLIENAIKYTLKGNVTVDIIGDATHATLSVHDTGIGIPKEDQVHLFQKFYRVDNSDTRDIGGTGLGLYLCRRLVETMGGRLWLESLYGEGSTFLVEFTRLSHEEATRKIETTPADMM
ncbi:MAG: ATP-binding protein [Candidatus Saccharibacteria bacterium]|nr:ATP-binding protein [Candidatus Saccharibacteria bacterium]